MISFKMDVYDNTEKVVSESSSNAIFYLRAILALMVVNIHAVNNEVHFQSGNIQFENAIWLNNLEFFLSQIVSRMAVPAFFLISSYFLYRKSFDWFENVKKKFFSLMLPYFLINSLWILFFWIGQSLPRLSEYFTMTENYISSWGIGAWLKAYGINSTPLVANLWFLRDLFVLNILAYVFLIIIKKAPRLTLILVLLFWLTPFQTHIFCLDKQAVCFWVIGAFFSIQGINIDYVIKKVNFVYICFAYVILMFADFFTQKAVYNSVLHGGEIVVGFIFWYLLIDTLSKKMDLKLLSIISTYSFGIYLFHEYSLNILNKLYARIIPSTVLFKLIGYFFMPCLIVFLCIVFCVLLEKYFPTVYRFLIGKKKSS